MSTHCASNRIYNKTCAVLYESVRLVRRAFYLVRASIVHICPDRAPIDGFIETNKTKSHVGGKLPDCI